MCPNQLCSRRWTMKLILNCKQDLQKSYYDKSSRNLPEVYQGDNVQVLSLLIISGNLESSTTKHKHRKHMFSECKLKRKRQHIRPSVESGNEDVSDHQSTLTAPESSLPSNTSAPTSPPKVEGTIQTPQFRRSSRVSKRPDRLNL